MRVRAGVDWRQVLSSSSVRNDGNWPGGLAWARESGCDAVRSGSRALDALVTACGRGFREARSLERFPPEHDDGGLWREMGPVIPQRRCRAVSRRAHGLRAIGGSDWSQGEVVSRGQHLTHLPERAG